MSTQNDHPTPSSDGQSNPSTPYKKGDRVTVTQPFLAYHSQENLEKFGPILGALADPLIPGETYEVLEVVETKDRRGSPVLAVALRGESPRRGKRIKAGPYQGAVGFTGRITPAWARGDELAVYSRTLGVTVEPIGDGVFSVGGSFDDVVKEIGRQRAVADESLEPWQREVKVGDHVVTFPFGAGCVSWCEVVDPLDDDGDDDEPEESEVDPEQAELERAEEEFAKRAYGPDSSLRFVRGHSDACPEGELGELHLSMIARVVTAEQFEKARELGWPQGLTQIARLLTGTLDKRGRRRR